MFTNVLTSFLCSLVLLSWIQPAFSLPPLYDVVNQGDISPLNPNDQAWGFGYARDRKVSAAPAEKGATVTQYEVEEVFSALARPVSSGVLDVTTLLPGPVTRTYTMNQGAATLHISAPATVITTAGVPIRIKGTVKDCTLDLEKQNGVCVEEGQEPMITVITNAATTTTSTYTATWTTTYTRPLELFRSPSAASMVVVNSAVLVSVGLVIGTMVAWY